MEFRIFDEKNVGCRCPPSFIVDESAGMVTSLSAALINVEGRTAVDLLIEGSSHLARKPDCLKLNGPMHDGAKALDESINRAIEKRKIVADAAQPASQTDGIIGRAPQPRKRSSFTHLCAF